MLSARLLLVCSLALTACQHSAEEAKIIGTWQYNPRNGTIWRMTFSRDHKVVLSNPHDATVDANLLDAKFDPVFFGTWRIDRGELIYTTQDQNGYTAKTTTRFKLAEFEHVPPLGEDRDATLVRVK